MPYDNDVRLRGVYVVRNNDNIVYIGSSKCMLNTLEYNHRNWHNKYGEQGRTLFRTKLAEEGNGWVFAWLIEPFACDAKTIEHVEGSLIRQLSPQLNLDRDPVSISIKYGRY